MASILAIFGGAFGIARILAILGPLSYIAYVAMDFKGQATTIANQKHVITELTKERDKLAGRSERAETRRGEHRDLINHYKAAVIEAGCAAKVDRIIRDRQNAEKPVFDQREGQ